MREALEARAQDALRLAKAAGADEVMAEASRRRTTQVEYREERVESVQQSASNRLSLRLWADGRYATHRTTDLRPESLSRFVRDAVALTRRLERDPFRQITDPALYQGRSTADVQIVDPGVASLRPEERIEQCRAIYAEARKHEQFVSATSGVYDTHVLSAMVSSNGFAGHHEQTSLSAGARVTLREEGEGRPEGAYYVSATHRDGLLGGAEVGRRARAEAVRRLGSQRGPTRRATMVVEPRAGGRLVRTLLRAANGRMFSQDRSFWEPRMGERVLAPRVTLRDEPLLPRGLGSRTYDSDGITARSLTLVDEGRLNEIYVDPYYASKIDRPPTTGETSNLVVASGRGDLPRLLRDVGQGICVTSWLGGNADATTGDFSLGLRGHLIEGGELAAPVGEMNITGNLVDLFAHLSAIGADPWVYGSFRTPTLVFEGVQFSGANA